MRVISWLTFVVPLVGILGCEGGIAPPPGSLGGACYGEQESCAESLVCEGGVCEAGLCYEVDCASGSTCSTSTGLCVPDQVDCSDVICSEQEVCDPATVTCVSGCAVATDLAILASEGVDVGSLIAECSAGPCPPENVQCIAHCLASGNEGSFIEGLGLSVACGWCFAVESACLLLDVGAVDTCNDRCEGDDTSEDCQACFSEYCTQAFCDCAGPSLPECAPPAPAE